MKHLSYEEFKKIIFESLEEAGMPPKPLGGAPKPLGSAPKPLGGAPKPLGGPSPINMGKQGPSPIGIAQTQQQNIPQNAPLIQQSSADDDDVTFSGKATKEGWHPGVPFAKYDNFYETQVSAEQDQTVLKLWIDYVHNIHAQRFTDILNKQFGDVVYAKKEAKANIPVDEKKNFMYYIKVIIRPGKNDDFINDVDAIVNALYSMPSPKTTLTKFKAKYDPSFKNEFITRIKDMVKKIPNEQEIEEVNMRIADNWVELLSTMKDPATMQKLGNISGFIASSLSNASANNTMSDVRGDNGFDAGHQLSFRNKIQVFAQDPNATFVTQEFQWRKWGHEVIDPSKFILVTVPSKKKVTSGDRDMGAKRAGFAGGYDEYKTRSRRGELQGGERHAVKMNSQFLSSDNVFFYTVKMYDVSNTRVIPGMTSQFLDGPNQERNLSNNLLGIPNAAAKTFNGTAAPAAVPASAPSNGISNTQIKDLSDSLIWVVNRKVTNSPKITGNPEKDIINYAYAYSQYLLEKVFHIAKKETAEAFSQGFTAAVAIAFGIRDDTAAAYLNSALNNRGRDSTLKQLIVQWFDEYSDLLEAVYIDMEKKLKSKGGNKVTKKVVEEDDTMQSASIPSIRPVPFEKFKELCGITDETKEYEEMDNEETDLIQESFFSLLDKMEKYGV